jgi:hypothetical protein
VSICPEWYDFSKFESWFSKQPIKVGWHLDKDLKSLDSKVYSPSTCCIIPPKINTFIAKFSKCKGYSFNKRRKKFEAYCRDNGEYIHLGLFALEEDARKAYVEYKKNVANKLINEYSSDITQEIKKAIINYIDRYEEKRKNNKIRVC